MSARKIKARRTIHAKTMDINNHPVRRTFLTIGASFAVLLAIYVLSPSLPVEATGMFASPTTYMSPLLVLAFMFLLATLVYFLGKK